MTTPDALEALADRVERATGADRELDLLIYLALNPDGNVARMMARGTKGLDGSSRFAWELRGQAFLFEQRDDRGNCTYNGGMPIPAYTGSLDAAMGLVPEGRHTEMATQDRHSLRWKWTLRGGYGVRSEARANNPALALTAAALRARAALVGEGR